MALDAIVIDFAVRNLGQVTTAFETIETRIQKMERSTTSTSEQQSKARVRTAQDESKQRELAAAKTLKEKERIEKQATKDMEAESARRAGIVRKSSEMAGRYASDLAKKEQREAQEATRAIEREEDRKMRIRIRSSEMAGRAAAQEAAQEIAAANRASAAWGQRGRRIGGIVSGSVGSLVSGVGAMAGATLGIGGGMLLASAARSEMTAEKSAALLINQVTSGGKAPAGATVGAVLGRASQLSTETGMSKEELIEGARSYSKTAKSGDFKGTMDNMRFFAQMSQVTGAPMSEIAGAAGMLQSQNQSLSGNAPKMQQMLLDLYAQTKSGSLGMTEMISQAGTMGSVRSAFQGDESANQRKLIALGQLVAPAAGLESGIMIKDLALEATKGKHLAAAKAMGVHFDKLDRIESPEQMIGAVLKSTGGNIGKITDVFGARGGTLLRELAGGYTEAVRTGGKGGGDKYVQDTIGSVASSTMSAGDLQKMHAATLENPGAQFEIALNKIKNTIEDKLEPRMTHFADSTLPKLVDKFLFVIDEAVKFGDWFADNPIKGVGAIVLAAITKDLASAGIGAGVKLVLEGLLKNMGGIGGGGAGVPGTPGTGTLGKVAAGVAIAGTAVALTMGGMSAIDAGFEAKNEKDAKRFANTTSATNMASALREKARSGKVTAADVAAAQAQASQLGTQIQSQQGSASTLHAAASIPIFGALQKDAAAGAEGAAKNTKAALDDLTKAIAMATGNLAKLGATAANTDPGAVRRNLPISQRPVQ